MRRQIGGEVQREVAGGPSVIQDVPLGLVAPIPQRDHEATEAAVAIRLHDAPQDRLASDVDKRFGQSRWPRGFGFPYPTEDDHRSVGRVEDVCSAA